MNSDMFLYRQSGGIEEWRHRKKRANLRCKKRRSEPLTKAEITPEKSNTQRGDPRIYTEYFPLCMDASDMYNPITQGCLQL